MLNNRRTKPSIFENMVGYIAKREYTEDKGPHIHTLFIYDGQKVSKDAFKGDQIGAYWKNEITDGDDWPVDDTVDIKARIAPAMVEMLNGLSRFSSHAAAARG